MGGAYVSLLLVGLWWNWAWGQGCSRTQNNYCKLEGESEDHDWDYLGRGTDLVIIPLDIPTLPDSVKNHVQEFTRSVVLSGTARSIVIPLRKIYDQRMNGQDLFKGESAFKASWSNIASCLGVHQSCMDANRASSASPTGCDQLETHAEWIKLMRAPRYGGEITVVLVFNSQSALSPCPHLAVLDELVQDGAYFSNYRIIAVYESGATAPPNSLIDQLKQLKNDGQDVTFVEVDANGQAIKGQSLAWAYVSEAPTFRQGTCDCNYRVPIVKRSDGKEVWNGCNRDCLICLEGEKGKSKNCPAYLSDQDVCGEVTKCFHCNPQNCNYTVTPLSKELVEKDGFPMMGILLFIAIGLGLLILLLVAFIFCWRFHQHHKRRRRHKKRRLALLTRRTQRDGSEWAEGEWTGTATTMVPGSTVGISHAPTEERDERVGPSTLIRTKTTLSRRGGGGSRAQSGATTHEEDEGVSASRDFSRPEPEAGEEGGNSRSSNQRSAPTGA